MKKVFLLSLAIVTFTPSFCFADVSTTTIFKLANDDRVQNGVPALKENSLLDQAAQMKADDMLARGYYAHLTPEGYSPTYWFDKVGYAYQNLGENLSLAYGVGELAINAGWMNSPEHRANILRPEFTELGVGVAIGMYQGEQSIFVVQEFGTPRTPTVPTPIAPKPPATTAFPKTLPVLTASTLPTPEKVITALFQKLPALLATSTDRTTTAIAPTTTIPTLTPEATTPSATTSVEVPSAVPFSTEALRETFASFFSQLFNQIVSSLLGMLHLSR